jgi:hypothetical protein
MFHGYKFFLSSDFHLLSQLKSLWLAEFASNFRVNLVHLDTSRKVMSASRFSSNIWLRGLQLGIALFQTERHR